MVNKEPAFHSHYVTVGPDGCQCCMVDKLEQDLELYRAQLKKVIQHASMLSEMIKFWRLPGALAIYSQTQKVLNETKETFKFLGETNESSNT
jgi:hypothetical protein